MSKGHGLFWKREGSTFTFMLPLLVFIGANLFMLGIGVGVVMASLALGS